MNIEERFRRARPEKIPEIVSERSEFLKVKYNLHPKRKNNLIVAAMYDAYQGGMSLDAIGKLYGKTRQAIYDTFRSRGYPLRSKQYKGLQVLDGIRFTLAKNGHLRGTLPDGRRVMMHWYVWERVHGPIPAGHCIYHVDKNPTNNALENLAILPKEMMGRYFNPTGRNQFSV